MDVAELVREARRLALLRFLLESPAYRMPLAVLWGKRWRRLGME